MVEGVGNFRGFFPAYSAGVFAGVVGKPASNFVVVFIDNFDDVSFFKDAKGTNDADR